MISFFEIWVSLKYLFPKTREKFFSLITLFSFLGISLGVATLIIVMSVMNGFREELTSKVLGINGHLKIKSINNDGMKRNLNLEKKILKNFDDLKINNVILSQGLMTYKGFSSGILIKGVSKDFFHDRKIFTNTISKTNE